MLKAVDTPTLGNVRFSRIEQRELEIDGFTWRHGVAIVRHKVTRLCYPYAGIADEISMDQWLSQQAKRDS